MRLITVTTAPPATTPPYARAGTFRRRVSQFNNFYHLFNHYSSIAFRGANGDEFNLVPAGTGTKYNFVVDFLSAGAAEEKYLLAALAESKKQRKAYR